jgi:UDP-N-acetylglucosamine 3-dehydrogenase
MTRVAVIGAGNIGKKHIRDYLDLDEVRVEAICDISEEALKSAQAEFKIGKGYTDFRDLLRGVETDVVVVCTPPALHKEVVVAAFECGNHVHCEKPLATSMSDADAMLQAQKSAGKLLFVNFSLRLYPAYSALHGMITSGEYGNPLWLSARYFLPVDPSVWIPPKWFWEKAMSGGHLMENGCHILDFILWTMGNVTRSTAMRDTLKYRGGWPPYFGPPDFEDVISVVMKHDNGAISTVTNGCIAPPFTGNAVELVTEKAFFRLDPEFGLSWTQGKNSWTTQKVDIRREAVAPARHFIDCIGQESKPIATGEDGRAALMLAHAIYDSVV